MVLLGASSQLLAQPVPTNNPIDTAYGSSAYPWTDNIQWNDVFNIDNYGGSPSDSGAANNAAINAAITAASQAGGGVVYLPGGTYNFASSIQLQNGVVIRGADPSGITSATQAGYAPATQMVFPKFNWQGISTPGNVSSAFDTITSASPYTDSNIGIVNVDVNGAAIAFGVPASSLTSGGTPSLAARNSDVVVYGVRSNNVALADPSSNITNGTNSLGQSRAGQVYDYRFTANILVQPWANALVANNRLNDIQSGQPGSSSFLEPNYSISNGSAPLPGTQSGGFAMFDYDAHYGIVAGRSGGINSNGNNIPSVDPYENRTGISIVGNYVYNSDRVKIEAGGYGTVVSSNVLDDANYTPFIGPSGGNVNQKISWVDSTGTKLTSGSTTLEERGVDITGWKDTVSNNNITVYRSVVGNNSAYATTDGEGILDQQSSGDSVNGLTISGNTINGSNISIYKMGQMRNLTITGNTLNSSAATNTNPAQIYAVADTNGGPAPAYNTTISNNSVASGIYFKASQYTNGTDGNVISGNTGTGGITYSTPNAGVSGNSAGALNPLPAGSLVDGGPAVSLLNPSTEFPTIYGSSATISVDVTDLSSSITSVEFFDQTTPLGAGTYLGNGQWSYTYSGLAPNQYMVSAVATAADGQTYSSSPEYFIVAVPEPASLGFLAFSGLMVLRRRHS